jgi:ribosomal peptide maturation radical SAM protein 1
MPRTFNSGLLDSADAIIVVPPFGGIDRPCLAAHLLQACAKDRGINVRVLYANLMFAREIGESEYCTIAYAPVFDLVGESFFAPLAFDREPFSEAAFYLRPNPGYAGSPLDCKLPLEEMQRLQERAASWVEEVAAEVCASGAPIVGCTSAFEQTGASVAILRAIRRRNPQCITLLGGANCQGEMAKGLGQLHAPIDFIFSGDSESTFPEFLENYLRNGTLPSERIVTGKPCMELDGLPTPEFDEYFEQRNKFLPGGPTAAKPDPWLPYESSRGCWWGAKQHCTFCGLNGEGMSFRERRPARVIDDLQSMSKKYRSKRVFMLDNIMPHSYFNSLAPALAKLEPKLEIFYEQKANLTLAKMVALRRAGIDFIQPGVESLSTDFLKLMRKGVTARQNVNMLRYARSVGISVSWQLLYAFPNDRAEYFAETLKLVRLLRHLEPALGIHHLTIDRFSPYFNQAKDYGIENVRPMPAYDSIFPPGAPLDQIGYHFVGEYRSESRENREVIRALSQEIQCWKDAWRQDVAPILSVVEMVPGSFMLLDTRSGSEKEKILFINQAQAFAALAGGRIEKLSEEAVQWALDNKVAVMLDGVLAPLAVAEPELLTRFEAYSPEGEKNVTVTEPLVHIAQAV